MGKHPLPDEICDGLAVFKELTEAASRRTSPENVSDVLDAVARLMRKNQAAAPSPATPEAEGDGEELPFMPSTDAVKPTEHMVDEALDGFNTMPATEGLRAQVEHAVERAMWACPVFAPPSKSVWALVDKWRRHAGEKGLHDVLKHALLNHAIELDEALLASPPAAQGQKAVAWYDLPMANIELADAIVQEWQRRVESGAPSMPWTTGELVEFISNLRPASPAPVPEGWVPVPREPTKDMIGTARFRVAAISDTNSFEMMVTEAYKAMLAAAPKGEG